MPQVLAFRRRCKRWKTKFAIFVALSHPECAFCLKLNLYRDIFVSTQPSGLGRDAFMRNSASGVVSAFLSSSAYAANALSDMDIADSSYDSSLERIFDTRIGSYLPAQPDRLFRKDRVSTSPIICIGETHTSPLHHHAQFRTIAALREASDNPLAIGLEMFYKTHQPALDRFVFQHGNLGKLAQDTNWENTWGYDYNNGYSKIFRYAHVHKLRLVGLNIPQEVVRMVRRDGLDGIPSRLREALPDMDLGVASHYERFERGMKAMADIHGPLNDVTLRRYYEALTLWEEAMAHHAVSYISKFHGRMVVMAGAAHLAHRDSMPDRIKKRMGGLAPFTIVPEGVEWDSSGLPVITHPPKSDTADWWWYTENERPPLPRAQKA